MQDVYIISYYVDVDINIVDINYCVLNLHVLVLILISWILK